MALTATLGEKFMLGCQLKQCQASEYGGKKFLKEKCGWSGALAFTWNHMYNTQLHLI
jgi:hypothetical protein